MTDCGSFKWTNPSVQAFAGEKDPVVAMEERAQSVVLSAMDQGWTGPPFDPIKLADLLHVAVQANADIRDARTISDGKDGFVIEFNPNRPRGRVRFSLAHEIAHTFFPDCAENVRNRAHSQATIGDNWQLELLCNVASSELIMPIGSFRELSRDGLELSHLMQLRKEYDVSTEAILWRATKLATSAASMFVAARLEEPEGTTRFRIEYSIASPLWRLPALATTQLSGLAILEECTAVGYTASNTQRWPGLKGLYLIQCVGMPPYPGARYPRIGGIVTPVRQPDKKPNQINYERGDATEPRDSGYRLIAHIVNDRTPNWGGGGFAVSVKKRMPLVQTEFREWVCESADHLKLGNVHLSVVDDTLSVVNMIAQAGYGPSASPRIKYEALSRCLERVSEIAEDRGDSVHMPRIGTGNAGGSWKIIEELIQDHLVVRGIKVTVYDLPANPDHTAADGFLSDYSMNSGFESWKNDGS